MRLSTAAGQRYWLGGAALSFGLTFASNAMIEPGPAMQYVVAGALGLGLAACSGFRVFVPLLAASIAYHTGYLAPAAGFAWLGTWAALITLATATVAEIAGY